MTLTSDPSVDWPFIGREEELQRITSVRAAGATGVMLLAPAGAGKTGLARAAAAAASAAGARVTWIQATRSAATVPLGAFAAVVPADARSDDLLELLSRSAESLRESSGRQPVVVVIDDAHLLDPTSAALTLHLAMTRTAFVLATIRIGEEVPDAIEALWKDAGAERMLVGPLPRKTIGALAEAALGAQIERRFTDWLAQTGRGNALYTRELIMGALADGTLKDAGGFWRLTRDPLAATSLAEIVGARLRGLDPGPERTLRLLSLGEPLPVRLLDVAAVGELEQRSLVSVGEDRQARVAHPLYGDVLRASLPRSIADGLRRELASMFSDADMTSDLTLRRARWLLDAGEDLSPDLLVEAAEAALAAGDSRLATRLSAVAVSAEARPDHVALYARALLAAGDLEAAVDQLARIEDHVAHSDLERAGEYVSMRGFALFWGLLRTDDAIALSDRALTWSDDPAWQTRISTNRLIYRAHLDDLALPLSVTTPLFADETTPASTRRRYLPTHAQALYARGACREAVDLLATRPPQPPLLSWIDQVHWSVLGVIGMESGVDLHATDAWAQAAFDAARRIGDAFATASAATVLGRLRLMTGQHEEARRWLAEATVAYATGDKLRTASTVYADRVALALADRDPAAADHWLQHTLSAAGERHPPLQLQVRAIRRAQTWAALAAGDPPRAQRIALDASVEHAHLPVEAAGLGYEALRAGAPARAVAKALAPLADRTDAPLVAAFCAHAGALAARSGRALVAVTDTLTDIGAMRYACEAAAHAAAAFADEGRMDSARRAAARMRDLHVDGPMPRLEGIELDSVKLTRREAQLVDLASRGLSNQDIADRLVLSVRTVESHLYHAMQKLGVSDRRDL